jgi:hypothetical protein
MNWHKCWRLVSLVRYLQLTISILVVTFREFFLLTFRLSLRTERRGILTTDEAELVCQWIRDHSNKERQTQAAKALAASLRSSDEAKISLSRRELCTVVADKERGCLGALLELVQAGVVCFTFV